MAIGGSLPPSLQQAVTVYRSKCTNGRASFSNALFSLHSLLIIIITAYYYS
jgi:hypothetical protein